MRGTRRRDTAAAPGLRRPGGALPRTCCLPSGLSPSVPEFHQVSRPMDSAGSRTITAGSELHRPRSTYCRQLVCHARYSRGHGVRHSCQGLAGTRAGDPPAGAGRRAAPFRAGTGGSPGRHHASGAGSSWPQPGRRAPPRRPGQAGRAPLRVTPGSALPGGTGHRWQLLREAHLRRRRQSTGSPRRAGRGRCRCRR
jgi:hypothetical protein